MQRRARSRSSCRCTSGCSPLRATAAERRLTEAIGTALAAVLVAEEDSAELVGLCTAYLELESVRYGQRCWVEDLAVDPEHRSQGVGGMLLDEAERWARERGASHFELDTGLAREDAQRFYERRGEPAKGFTYSWPL
jgi:GNAT superfamily N-acetyltransferase